MDEIEEKIKRMMRKHKKRRKTKSVLDEKIKCYVCNAFAIAFVKSKPCCVIHFKTLKRKYQIELGKCHK